MAERAAAATKRRQRLTIIGAGAAAALVIVLVIVLVVVNSGGKKATPSASGSASASSSASAAAAGTCTWHPNPDPSASPAPSANPNLRDVGTPPASGNPTKGYRDMTINTNLGQIVIELNLSKAPCTGASFTYLAGKNFFNGSSCHRMVNKSGTDPQSGQPSDFHVLQCGDPSGTGQGGPKYQFDNEYVPTDLRPAYPAAVEAMANSGGSSTNGSQFFIVFGDTLLDANYTIFGRVIKGLDVAQKVGAAGDDGSFEPNPGGGKPKLKLTFTSVTVGSISDTPAPAPAPSPSPSPSPSHS
jgi:peptidyl-prolyl cis-trans isomerase B (cyclophilin B)